MKQLLIFFAGMWLLVGCASSDVNPVVEAWPATGVPGSAPLHPVSRAEVVRTAVIVAMTTDGILRMGTSSIHVNHN